MCHRNFQLKCLNRLQMYWLFFYDWFSINIIYENTYFNELDINSNFLNSIIYITDMHSYILSVRVKSNKKPISARNKFKWKSKSTFTAMSPLPTFHAPTKAVSCFRTTTVRISAIVATSFVAVHAESSCWTSYKGQ